MGLITLARTYPVKSNTGDYKFCIGHHANLEISKFYKNGGRMCKDCLKTKDKNKYEEKMKQRAMF